MKFIGNNKIVESLSRSLQTGNVAQAYLFSGPEHVGKKTLAEVFARALIIGMDKLELALENDKAYAMDFILIEPEREEKKGIIKIKDISVEKIREVQELLAQYPYGGKKKVLIIDDAHRLTIGAQNALLKTLEEPNSTSVLILVTHQPGRILSTLHSRMQKINFSLVENNIDNEMVELAMGRPGMVKLLEGSADLLERLKDGEMFFRKLDGVNMSERLFFAEKISKDVAGAILVLQLWLWLIEREISNSADRLYLASLDEKSQVLSNCIEALEKTNASARLALESMLLRL